MEPLNLEDRREHFSSRLKQAEANCCAIADFEKNSFPEWCYPGNSGNYVHENGECPFINPNGSIDAICPFEELDLCKSQLTWIKNVALLSYYFQNPSAAQSQNMLSNFGYNGYIHSYK